MCLQRATKDAAPKLTTYSQPQPNPQSLTTSRSTSPQPQAAAAASASAPSGSRPVSTSSLAALAATTAAAAAAAPAPAPASASSATLPLRPLPAHAAPARAADGDGLDLGRVVDGVQVLKAQLKPLRVLHAKTRALFLWEKPLRSAALCAALLLGCVFPGASAYLCVCARALARAHKSERNVYWLLMQRRLHDRAPWFNFPNSKRTRSLVLCPPLLTDHGARKKENVVSLGLSERA